MSWRMLALGTLAVAVLVAADVHAEFRVERRLTLQPGGTFVLDAAHGAVVVTGDSPSGVTVTITSNDDEFDRRFDIEVEERPGEARMTVRARSEWTQWFTRSYFRGRSTRFVVRVPRDAHVDLRTSGGSLEVSQVNGRTRLRTSGGSVRIRDVNGPSELRTSGGSIDVNNVGGDLDAQTSGGTIRLAQVGGTARAETSGGSIVVDGVTGDLAANTSGGSVRIRDAGGRVAAHTSGGPVSVAFLDGNARGGTISTSGGSIVAALDRRVSLSIDASSSGGNVTSDLPMTVHARTRRSLRGDLNGGGEVLRIQTSGGSVSVSPK